MKETPFVSVQSYQSDKDDILFLEKINLNIRKKLTSVDCLRKMRGEGFGSTDSNEK